MFIGLLILLFPGASLVVLAWILGLWLIFFGATAVATGLAARKLLEKARSAVLYWPLRRARLMLRACRTMPQQSQQTHRK